MKKSNLIVAIIVLIFISLLTITITITSTGKVPVVNVKAEVSVTGNKTALTIVTLEQDAVNPLKSPRGSATTSFPSVDALAIINNAKVSYWASNPYVGDGTYDFVIGFPKSIAPQSGDMVKVVVKVVDVNGNSLASEMGILLWQ
jgi:hypothetical protein